MGTDQNSKAYLGHLMALATIVIYSFNTNFMKTLMPDWINPFALVLLRTSSCAIGYWVICLFIKSAREQKPSGKDKVMMMLGGVLGMGANMLLYINGVAQTGPVDAFIIRTFQPTIVFVLSVIFLHKVFNFTKFTGIIIGLLGAVYVSIVPHGGVTDSFWGDVQVLFSSVAYAFFLVLIKPYTQRFNPFLVMKWMSLSAFVFTFPFGIKELIEAPVFHHSFEWIVWGKIAFTLIFSTMGAYILALGALHYISAFKDSLYIYLLPVFGTAVAMWIGTDKFSWHDPIGLLLILIGFYLINRETFNQMFSKNKLNKQNSNKPNP
ncbi:MAG: DMT family transporter [Bacteroidales bacterium]